MDDFNVMQSKFITQINNCVANDILPQAIILENSSALILNAAIDYIVLRTLTKQDITVLSAETKQRLIEQEEVDMLVFDLAEENMKKNAALNIQERFMFTSISDNNKQFYIIKSIDKASASVLNALLKFLEEPYDNVYAIFTTANINKVLPTIVSRCINFHLINSSKDSIIALLRNEFAENDIELVYLATNDELQTRRILTSGVYDEFKNNISRMLAALFSDDFYVVCYEILGGMEKEDLDVFFALMYALLTHQTFVYSYLTAELKDKFYGNGNYGKLIDVILSARMQLQTNMNIKLIIDMFSIGMEDLINENS